MTIPLEEHFRIYRLDLPGFGESNIEIPLTVEEVSEILHGFVLKMEIDKPILLGHSYGGRVAICYAAKYPVEKLILVSSAGVKKRLKFSKRFKVKLYKILKKCHITLTMGSSDYQQADDVKKKMLVQAVNTDLQEQMKKITAPTLLLYGSEDRVTDLTIAQTIRKRIAHSTLIILEGCGHFPYLERPSYFSLILMSFLIGDSHGV